MPVYFGWFEFGPACHLFINGKYGGSPANRLATSRLCTHSIEGEGGLADAELRRPIGQCEAEALHVRMPGQDLPFDGRYLLAAARDSRSLLETLPGDVGERASITFQHRWLACVALIAPHNTVGVLGIDLHQSSLTAAALAGNQR